MKRKSFVIHLLLSILITMLFIMGWKNFEFLYARETHPIFSDMEFEYIEIENSAFSAEEILRENFKQNLNNKILDDNGILLFKANGSAGIAIVDGNLNYSHQVVEGRYFEKTDFQSGDRILAIEDSYLAKKYSEGVRTTVINGRNYDLIGIISKKEFIGTISGINVEYIYPYINEREYIGSFYIINPKGEYQDVEKTFHDDSAFQYANFKKIGILELDKRYLFKEIFKSDLMFKFIVMSVIFGLLSILFYVRWELGNENFIRNVHFIFGATKSSFLRTKKHIFLGILLGGICGAIICTLLQPFIFSSEYYKFIMMDKKDYLLDFETVWIPITYIYIAVYLINYITYSYNWERNWVKK